MAPAAPPPPVAAQVVGHSVQGRPIRLIRVGDPAAPRRILVVGCIHGNEAAGIRITRALRRVAPPAGAQWLILDALNPDGCAHGTRGNADGVDLNRNFPTGWRPLDGVYESGPRPSSEPETRAAERLILRERPAVTIWYHQHMNGVVFQHNSSRRLVVRYARIAHMRTIQLAQLPGTAPRWEVHRLRGAAAFAVELPGGRLRAPAVAAQLRAVTAIAR
jgi:murein peptide amidase A